MILPRKDANGERWYGRWVGNPRGRAENLTRCICEVTPAVGWQRRQCSRKRGHGPGGAFCKQHAKRVEPSHSPGCAPMTLKRALKAELSGRRGSVTETQEMKETRWKREDEIARAGAKTGNPFATLCTNCYGRHWSPRDTECPRSPLKSFPGAAR